MKVIVIGNQVSIKEFELKFSNLINRINNTESIPVDKKSKEDNFVGFSIKEIIFFTNYDDLDPDVFKEKAIVFDYYIDDSIENLDIYKDKENLIVFANIPKSSLSEVHFSYENIKACLFGFNGLPGMTNRQYLEVSSYDDKDKNLLKEVCETLDTQYLLVDDRVGMVTPRIISMVINEAYFTVQEGTANKNDIDIAMKLGTNYPWGPFEWCQKIGIRNIYELLEAVYEDTKDERYKICPLLKKEYMRSFSQM
ncbi:MAG: 3-hydroxyacyl-CoA dehydrogenase family protein [Bacteroidota bacterium]|nr:3-hydroxyacyl-CoA dehydrogenase family protein [Bacteroidota bacterium]